MLIDDKIYIDDSLITNIELSDLEEDNSTSTFDTLFFLSIIIFFILFSVYAVKQARIKCLKANPDNYRNYRLCLGI